MKCYRRIGGSTSLRDLQPHVRDAARVFIAILRTAYEVVRVTSTRRSPDAQRKLWENYLNGCSRYPAAPPGQSVHATGRAFDLHLEPGIYGPAGDLWERAGGIWGGRFGDEIHFEV